MKEEPLAGFVRAYPPAVPPPGAALWLPFAEGQLLVRPGSESLYMGTAEALDAAEPLFLGTLDGLPCLAADVGSDIPDGWEAHSPRALFGRLSEAEYALAGYASQILYWRRTSAFCPVCGHGTEARDGDWGRRCSQCGHVGYPHLSPATLILVHDGPRLLLAQKPGWGTRWSILAGFVEPGESLEECVRRETREEVGLDVTDLVYAGSQPWPYPHQLMVGFTARRAGGDIVIDGAELERADWFGRDSLPDLPPPVSLSRQMIDAWVERDGQPDAS